MVPPLSMIWLTLEEFIRIKSPLIRPFQPRRMPMHSMSRKAAVRATAAAGFRIILLIACVVAVPIFMLRGQLSLWFTDSREVCSLVAAAVVPLIAYQFGDGLQCTFANALRGIAHVRPMMLIAFFSYFVVSLPLGWLLGIRLGLGLVGIWWAFPVCLTCAGALYYLAFRKKTG